MAVIVKRMTVQEWIDVPDNPRQRDTIRHARKAKRTHLMDYEEPHQVVFAASIKGELVCKLDGHTRAYLWETGELERPRCKLIVNVCDVQNMKEAKRLYSMFDNQSATENAGDRLSGACREHRVVCTSPLLRSFKFVVALQCATGFNQARREYDYVKLWKEELEVLDSWDLSAGIHTSLIALALVLICKGEEKAEDFFKKYDKDEGTKTERGNDGVQALTVHFTSCKANRLTAGWDNIQDLFERAYTCYQAFSDGRRMKSGPRRTKREKFATIKTTLPKIETKESK